MDDGTTIVSGHGPREEGRRTILLLHRGGRVIRGTEAVLIHSAKAFAAAGYQLVVCRNDGCIDDALRMASPATEIVDFRFPELMIAGIRETSLPIPAYIKALLRLKALAERCDPAFLYCSGGLPCQLAVPVGRMLEIPVICHFHHPAIRRALYLWLVRYADRLMFPSAFVQAHARRDLRHPGDVIYNGIDLARFQPAWPKVGTWRAQLGIPADAVVIGQVGALVPHKRPQFLLSVFSSLLQRTALRLHLCLVGAGPMEGKLQNLANDLGIGGNVTITGYVDDVLPYFQHVFDINVLVSMEEGLGIAVLEGSACGLPAVVANCTGLPETIVEGRTGFLFDPSDEDALQRHLVRLAEHPSLRAVMGRAGMALVKERFSSTAYSEKLLASVSDLLGNGGVGEVLPPRQRSIGASS